MKNRPFLKKGIKAGLAIAGSIFIGQALATPVLPADTGVIFKYSDYEAIYNSSGDLVSPTTAPAVGDQIVEIFDIASVNNAANPSITYWASGLSDNTILTGMITGMTVTGIIPNSTGDELTFSGGAVSVYEVPTTSLNVTNPTLSISGLEAQICPGGTCPTAFLTLNDIPGIILGDPATTLVTQTTGLTAPLTGQGAGDLEIAGGTFASVLGLGNIGAFNSDFSSCIGATGAFASLCSGAGGWEYVSEDPVTFTTAATIPEPGSLFLLGLGLISVVIVRSRLRRTN